MRKRHYFMMESAMTARLCDTSGKMNHGILFDRCLSGPDGETKGRVMFSKYGNVDVSASYFKGRAFLTIGHIGCHSEVSR